MSLFKMLDMILVHSAITEAKDKSESYLKTSWTANISALQCNPYVGAEANLLATDFVVFEKQNETPVRPILDFL